MITSLLQRPARRLLGQPKPASVTALTRSCSARSRCSARHRRRTGARNVPPGRRRHRYQNRYRVSVGDRPAPNGGAGRKSQAATHRRATGDPRAQGAAGMPGTKSATDQYDPAKTASVIQRSRDRGEGREGQALQGDDQDHGRHPERSGRCASPCARCGGPIAARPSAVSATLSMCRPRVDDQQYRHRSMPDSGLDGPNTCAPAHAIAAASALSAAPTKRSVGRHGPSGGRCPVWRSLGECESCCQRTYHGETVPGCGPVVTSSTTGVDTPASVVAIDDSAATAARNTINATAAPVPCPAACGVHDRVQPGR